MADLFDTLYSVQGQSEEEPVQPKGREATVTDYAKDIVFNAPAKGVSLLARSFLELGAIPLDLAFNTDFLKKIDNIFTQEGFFKTPETKTWVGDVEALLVEYGLPSTYVAKFISAVPKLSKLSQFTKLSELEGAGAKGVELAKRAGYFGAIGGISDFIASVPEESSTLSEAFGLVDKTELGNLEGRDRAAATLSEKLKFGAEGSVVGGAIPLLPTGLTLGAKYGIIKPLNYATPVLGGMYRAIEYPVSKAIEAVVGKGEVSVLQKAAIKGGELLDDITKNLPPNEQWRNIKVENGLGDQVLRKIRRVQDYFTTSGPLTPEIKRINDLKDNAIAAKVKTADTLLREIETAQEGIVTNFKTNLFDTNKESLNMIQYKTNQLGDFVKYKGQKFIETEAGEKILNPEYKRLFNELDPVIRKDALRLRTKVQDFEKEFKDFKNEIDFQGQAATDLDTRMKRILPSFNNKKFSFDPTKEEGAMQFFREQILGNKELKDEVLNIASKEAGKPVTTTSNEFFKALDKATESKVLDLKNWTIRSDLDPETIFKGVANRTAVDSSKLRSGEFLDQRIKSLLSVPKDSYVMINGVKTDVPAYNFKTAVLDSVISQAKQIYGRRAYDEFARRGVEDGWLFTKDSAVLRGMDTSKLRPIVRPNGPENILTDSQLFKGEYYALPEISHALTSNRILTDSLYDLPFYKEFMTLKTGAQLSKTLGSPVTQVKNFTTAGFFPLMNGLIGGEIGFKDAMKLVATDVFGGARTSVEQINKLENYISRNVMSQNVQLQEMRNILEKAKNGNLSFDQLMNSRIMTKAGDIYQGADNIWRVFTDTAYQGALRQAFGNPDDILKMIVGPEKKALEEKFMNNIREWYRDIAKEKFLEINPITGQRKTVKDALEDVSAYLTSATIPTYNQVPRIIQEIRSLPLGNFIAFPAEILRTSANVISLGARELTSSNPYIRQMGAKRLIGATTVLGGIGTVATKTAQHFTGVSQEQLDSFQRSYAPSYEQNSTLIPITSPDAEGKFKYYNFSYTNPYDAMVTPVNAILKSFADGKLNKDSVDTIVMNSLFGGVFGSKERKGAITEFLTPFVSESIGTERAIDLTLRGGRAANGKIIYYKDIDPPGVKIAKGIGHLLGGLEPGAVTSARRIWDGVTGRFTDSGTVRDAREELIALMSGVRVEEAKPLSSIPFIVTSFNKDKQAIGGKFSSIAYNPSSTPEEKLAAYKTYLMQSYENQNKMHTTIKDGINLGINKYKLGDLLEDRLSKSEVDNILSGDFLSPSISEKAFDSMYERIKSENPIQALKLKSQNREVFRIFDTIKDKMSRLKLNLPPEQIEKAIDKLLSPSVIRTREIQKSTPYINPSFNIGPTSSNIQQPTPTSPNVSRQVVSASQPNLGSRYNLTPSGLTATQEAFLTDPLERAYYQQKNLQTGQV
jgi:hypothetical protein